MLLFKIHMRSGHTGKGQNLAGFFVLYDVAAGRLDEGLVLVLSFPAGQGVFSGESVAQFLRLPRRFR